MPGTSAGRSLFVPPNVPGTPGRCPGDFLNFFQDRKFSPKRKFRRPAKNFGQALQILEKQAFRNGHPTRTSMKKLRSENFGLIFRSLFLSLCASFFEIIIMSVGNPFVTNIYRGSIQRRLKTAALITGPLVAWPARSHIVSKMALQKCNVNFSARTLG